MNSRPTLLTTVLALSVTFSFACAKSETPPPADSAAPAAAPEAKSPSGTAFYPREIPAERRAQLEADLSAAQRGFDAAPTNADSIIWLGRRLGYLERFQEAIRVFTDGIAKHPEDARIYRFRGHRYVSVREFDKAIADLTRASELIKGKADSLEPDGAPNKLGIPTSTQHGNIWYHLALAHYLKADYEASLKAWEEAFRIATNDDTRIAVNDWRYMTLKRLHRDADADALLKTVNKDLKVIENTAYFKRMLMYKGELPVDSLLRQGETDALQYTTQGYGVGNWYLEKGDSARAKEIFTNVVNGGYWGAFGFIAAETDLSRWPK